MKLDGRPMSGDIGRGATRETIAFAAQLALSNDRPPGSCTDLVPEGFYSCHFTNKLLVSFAGFLQLAGGTNFHTVDGLKKERLFQSTSTLSKFDLSPCFIHVDLQSSNACFPNISSCYVQRIR